MIRPTLWLLFVLLGGFATSAQTAGSAPAKQAPNRTETAVFAGGCFWCVEKDFDHVSGVVRTTSGYTGGTTANPTYKDVTQGDSGHYEAVQIEFDPEEVRFEELVEIFWRSVDPTDAGGQFCDRGDSYRTAIFAQTPQQRRIAESSKAKLDAMKRLDSAIVTPIIDAAPFYAAETYHQDYYKKNPGRYTFYRFTCGRDRRVKALWGDQAHRGIKQ